MKTIITSMFLAIAVFSMAIPTNNKAEKKARKAVATAVAKPADKKEQTKSNVSAEDKKAEREAALLRSKNSIGFNNNGGGRTAYH